MSRTVNGLEVQFTVLTPTISTLKDLALQIVVTNRSSSDLKLNCRYIDVERIALAVRHSGGEPVHPGLLGMPQPDDGQTGRRILKPGESETFKLAGEQYTSEELPDGKYQIRFHYQNLVDSFGDWTGQIETDWRDFTITHPTRK